MSRDLSTLRAENKQLLTLKLSQVSKRGTDTQKIKAGNEELEKEIARLTNEKRVSRAKKEAAIKQDNGEDMNSQILKKLEQRIGQISTLRDIKDSHKIEID